MYFVSLTRLRVRSWIYLPRFLLANEASVKSIKQIKGFVSGKELVDKGLVFWTVTLWDSMEAMKQFRNNDPHKTAMRKLPVWCDEGSYAHWTQDDSSIPDWQTLHQKMITIGKLTKVKNASPRQEGMNYPSPARTKSERNFKSAILPDKA